LSTQPSRIPGLCSLRLLTRPAALPCRAKSLHRHTQPLTFSVLQVECFQAHAGVVCSMAMHPKGECLLTSSVDGTIKVWV